MHVPHRGWNPQPRLAAFAPRGGLLLPHCHGLAHGWGCHSFSVIPPLSQAEHGDHRVGPKSVGSEFRSSGVFFQQNLVDSSTGKPGGLWAGAGLRGGLARGPCGFHCLPTSRLDPGASEPRGLPAPAARCHPTPQPPPEVTPLRQWSTSCRLFSKASAAPGRRNENSTWVPETVSFQTLGSWAPLAQRSAPPVPRVGGQQPGL